MGDSIANSLSLGYHGGKQPKADTENPDVSQKNKDKNAKTESPKENKHQNSQQYCDTVYEFLKYIGAGMYMPLRTIYTCPHTHTHTHTYGHTYIHI